jgi:hypothetical protein
MPSLRVLIIAWLVALAGCASEPPVQIAASTWRQVDSDIAAASRAASAQAREEALTAMQRWRGLVYRQTDDAFIPWFSSYWTQQWLSIKVSWYKLSAEGEKDPTVNRLALYLQEQYQDRVLEPLAKETGPEQIMQRTTERYVRQLDQRLQGIGPRHGVPQEQFDQRLRQIPAIALAPGASLYQVVHADPLDRLPAYRALINRIRSSPGGLSDWSADPGFRRWRNEPAKGWWTISPPTAPPAQFRRWSGGSPARRFPWVRRCSLPSPARTNGRKRKRGCARISMPPSIRSGSS